MLRCRRGAGPSGPPARRPPTGPLGTSPAARPAGHSPHSGREPPRPPSGPDSAAPPRGAWSACGAAHPVPHSNRGRGSPFPAPGRKKGSGAGKAPSAAAAVCGKRRCSISGSIVLDRDDDADLLARRTAKVVVPAGELVFVGVDITELGGVILALVPQVDLCVIGHLIASAARQPRGRAHPVDLQGHQLNHGLDRAGGLLPGRNAARDDRVLDGRGEADLRTVDVADVSCAAADEVQDLLEGGAGDLCHLFEADAQQRTGVAGQLLPRGREDIAGDDAPQDLAGGGHQQVRHLPGYRGSGRGGSSSGRAAGGSRSTCGAGGRTGSGRGGGRLRGGSGTGGIAARLEAANKALEIGVVGGEVLHVVQHAVLPQIAGDVVQD